MDHYIDIKLRPDPEFQESTLMSALFAKLHRVLAERAQGDIGISFPEHQRQKPCLGNVLRLHSAEAALDELMSRKWLSGMRDHASLCDILPIPPDVHHRVVRRVQAKSSPERLRRRQMKRHDITAEEALNRVPDSASERLTLPYVRIRSASTRQSFTVFIEHGPLATEPATGTFGTYGLSPITTIPWF